MAKDCIGITGREKICIAACLILLAIFGCVVWMLVDMLESRVEVLEKDALAGYGIILTPRVPETPDNWEASLTDVEFGVKP